MNHLGDVAREVELVDAAQDDVIDLHGVGRGERRTAEEDEEAVRKSFSIKGKGNFSTISGKSRGRSKPQSCYRKCEMLNYPACKMGSLPTCGRRTILHEKYCRALPLALKRTGDFRNG